MWIPLALTIAVAAPPVPAELAPGTRYDPAIPTLQAITGHDFGGEVTAPRDMELYLEALAAAAAQRTHLATYARSWEGRPLHVLAIAAPDRLAQLDQVKQGLQRLADPRGLADADAQRLIDELPVVTWLLHGVHGNEISSGEAALALAYHLLAAQDDPQVESILRESIVLIDPNQNPDGRARFVSQTRQGRAAAPDPDPFSAEHDEPWPRGRSNHYLFDMNRDWFALTQPETRGRVRVAREWAPHVVVDLHEMSGEATYYFAPPADPINPYVTADQRRWFDVFGRANAERFDERGFAYFVREIFDSFYPGYGESWPVLNGAIGATFEQASPRGLVYRRIGDGRLLTYRQATVQHFTAALTTAATAASHRANLLRDFLAYRRSAVAEGRNGNVRAYLFAPGPDPALTTRLARLLAAQGIDVLRTQQPLATGGRQLPAGTYVVPLAQPTSRLIRSLFDLDVPMDDAFVSEQQRRRSKRLPSQIYDLTGWSLPLLFDVDLVTSDADVTVPAVAVREDEGPAGAAELPAARVAYLLPWGSGAAAAVSDALQAGLLVRHAGRPFSLGGRAYPEGTAIVRVSDNAADLRHSLGRIAARHEAEVVPVDASWVADGISLGSSEVRALKTPRVLLLWDTPTRSLSAGWARYVLEQRYGQPVSAVRVASLGRVPLDDYNVVVVPEGDYEDALNEGAVARLRNWVRAGGTLVTLGEASRWAARKSVGLLKTHTQLRDGRPETDDEGDDKKKDKPASTSETDQPYRLEDAVKPKDERPDEVPGALLRVRLDREHWLASGSDGELQAVVESRRVFAPITLDEGRNVGVYAEGQGLVASGLVWKEARDLLAQKAFLIHQPAGRGHIVAFAEDPNYRAFAEATQLLFINAVLLGPAY